MPNYTNSDMRAHIEETVHSVRDRRILILKYIDGLSNEKIAEMVELTPRQIGTITRHFRKTSPLLR